MPVSVPSDKRFRRAHVSPARSGSWRERAPRLARAIVALAVVVYGVYYVAGLALSAEALTVTRITVSGNSRISRGEVIALLEGIQGANMLTVNIEAWRQKLLRSPWVAEAAIRRVFPGTLSVVVSERHPLGIGRVQGHLYLIDSQGFIIDEFGPNYAELDLPIIDGLAAKGASMVIDEERAALAGRLLADLEGRPQLAKRVSQIDVSDPHDAVVVLARDTVLVRLGEDRFVERLQSYLDLVPALRERITDIDYVDLRFDERVYVRPQGEGVRVRTAGPKAGATVKEPAKDSGAQGAAEKRQPARRKVPSKRGRG
jgi:cell division protein FtsQ